MFHIFDPKEEELHDVSESTTCDCGTKLIVDPESGDMFIIHRGKTGYPSDSVIQQAIAIAVGNEDEGVF